MSVFYSVGRYICEIKSQALGEAGTGTPQFILRFTVMGEVDDDGNVAGVNRSYERTMYRAITEKTIPYLIEDLKALGFRGSSFRDLDPSSPSFFDLSGQEVEMYCAHEDGTNGEREKWSVAFAKREAQPVKAVDSKKLRDLDNLFGKHLKELAPKSGGGDANKRLKPVPVAASTQVADEDVPF
jgi:hypothetical protein